MFNTTVAFVKKPEDRDMIVAIFFLLFSCILNAQEVTTARTYSLTQETFRLKIHDTASNQTFEESPLLTRNFNLHVGPHGTLYAQPTTLDLFSPEINTIYNPERFLIQVTFPDGTFIVSDKDELPINQALSSSKKLQIKVETWHDIFDTTSAHGSKKLSQIAWAVTHNAAAFKERFLIPITNQSRSIEQQLCDGIRGFQLRVADHCQSSCCGKETKIAYACHGVDPNDVPEWLKPIIEGLHLQPCDIDPARVPLADVLKKYKQFLIAHPRELLLIILENRTSHVNQLTTAFQQAALADDCFTYNGTDTWPTIEELRAAKKRAIVFLAGNHSDSTEKPSYMNNSYEFIFNSPWGYKSSEELIDEDVSKVTFTASPAYYNRGLSGLLNVSHSCTPLTAGSEKEADQVNSKEIVLKRLKDYQQLTGVNPTFLSVDFYQLAKTGVLQAIREYNMGLR